MLSLEFLADSYNYNNISAIKFLDGDTWKSIVNSMLLVFLGENEKNETIAKFYLYGTCREEVNPEFSYSFA